MTSSVSARNAEMKVREALVDKLGIDLTPGHPAQLDELDRMLLQPNAANSINALSEENLGKLFGLASTDLIRDLLSGGVTSNDPHRQIKRWNLYGVEWNRNTDRDGTVYVFLLPSGTGSYVVELYTNRDRMNLVARGESAKPTAAVQVEAWNFSGLSGSIEIGYPGDPAPIRLAAIPEVLSWRLRCLRKVWQQADWLDRQEARPLIDPDLIALNDVRSEILGNPAVNLWNQRLQKIKQWRDDRANGRIQAINARDWLKARFTMIWAFRGTICQR